ncbi:thymidine kinase [Actinorhabdospora filicis]|uniref:thymidine kinase n=1 Tax=Actinorhabdospora filicis TaxID=1785913 RepID=UPI002552D72A|nr:thymidine kinase [Actinorhabdospora filicis]
MPVTARLKFYYGPMDCGKSTLALQIHHNHTRSGRRGLLLTRHDRSGGARITTRIGLAKEATELTDGDDLRAVAQATGADYVICDEVQFYPAEHVEQMADLVDCDGVDVYAFGLATDFRSKLFPATRRLLELADEALRLQVEVLCWCGAEGQLNARVVDGRIARAGEQVVIGDTDSSAVHYQVLCRKHYRSGELSLTPMAEAMALDPASGCPPSGG